MNYSLKEMSQLSSMLVSNAAPILAEAIKESIKDRLMLGLGVNDTPMQPYTEATRRQREKQGRQTGVRDLRATGRMLDDLDVRETEQGLEIYFKSVESANKAYHTDLQTPWLTITQGDLQRIQRKILEKASRITERE